MDFGDEMDEVVEMLHHHWRAGLVLDFLCDPDVDARNHHLVLHGEENVRQVGGGEVVCVLGREKEDDHQACDVQVVVCVLVREEGDGHQACGVLVVVCVLVREEGDGHQACDVLVVAYVRGREEGDVHPVACVQAEACDGDHDVVEEGSDRMANEGEAF